MIGLCISTSQHITWNDRMVSIVILTPCSNQIGEDNWRKALVLQPRYAKSARHVVFVVNFKIVF